MGLSWILLAILGVVVVLRILRYGQRPKGYPPGPPTLPFIGNLHQLPRSGLLHEKFQEWADQYGPVVSIKLGSQTMILLNDRAAVKELLDKRSQNTSARMDMFLGEFGGHNQILMRNNDETWRRQRRMYHRNLNGQNADVYLPYQDYESIQLLGDLLQTPAKFEDNLKRYTASIGYTIAYGMRINSIEKNKAARTLFEWTAGQVIVGMGLAITDWWPFLRILFRNMPTRIIPFLGEIDRLNRIESDLWDEQYQIVRRKVESGHVRPSFCRDMIVSNDEKDGFLSEKDLKFNAGHAWAAASDTQFTSLLFFIKAMLLYPQCQKKAQEEIDAIVGADRLPKWSDWDSLPYTRGVLKETMRFYPATITGGMPHAVVKDDIYLGYTIPAGAGLVNNVWAVNNAVENPRNFDPTRFLEDSQSSMESAVQADASKRDHFTFGAGRRICPGAHVADRGLFVAMTRLLWSFNFEPFPGEKVEQDAFQPGFITSPVPFRYAPSFTLSGGDLGVTGLARVREANQQSSACLRCQIKPRSELKRHRITALWEQSKSFLHENGDYIQEFYDKMVRGEGVTV